MRLYLVEAVLATPAVIGQGDHLDGVLWSATREARSRVDATARLPVASVTMYGHRINLVSAILPGSGGLEQPLTFAKRRDARDVEQLAKPLHRGLGPGKDKILRRSATAGTLRWYAVAGRGRPLRKLLQRVFAIGRDIRAGCGRVESWTVTKLGEDRLDLAEVLVSPEGLALRNLPPRWCSFASTTTTGGLAPPYWANHVDVVPVGAKVNLDQHVAFAVRRQIEVGPRARATDLRLADKLASIRS